MSKKISKLGKIVRITEKASKKGNPYFIYELDEGTGKVVKFSSFSEQFVKQGDLVTVELSQNGEYLNLETLEKMQQDIPEIKTADQLSVKDEREATRQKSIVTQSVFNMAWEIVKWHEENKIVTDGAISRTPEEMVEETIKLMAVIREKLKGEI